MATAIIYVFSGTGNTLTAANMLKKQLDSNNIKTQVYEVKRPFGDFPMPAVYDYVGFGYPVHAFNTPQLFLQFIKMFPQMPGKKAFIFKTSGEPFSFNDASSYKLWKLLTERKFDVVLEKHLLMPYNIVFRYNDSLVKQMLIYNKALSSLFVSRLLNGERDAIKYRLRHRAVSAVFRIQWFGAKLNGRLHSVNDKKCAHCMRCANNCPSGNISLKDGKIKFDGQCAMCMRCAMFCPKGAVNIGFLHFWKVNGAYDFDRILSDPDILADFINSETKGYFRLFRKYYDKANQELKKNSIDLHHTISDCNFFQIYPISSAVKLCCY
ncbi:MAG: EFR1 family ferrodoxin [Eubacteriales bacterium]|nr:EFR1 family ferrodoxin [Eubacteriales bacterium]